MYNKEKVLNNFLPVWYINAFVGLANPVVFIIRAQGVLRSVCKYLYDAVAIFIGLGLVIFVVKANETKDNNSDLLLKYINVIVNVTLTFGSITSIAMNILKRKKLLFILNQLHNSEKRINEFGKFISHKKNRRCVKQILVGVVTFWVIQCIFISIMQYRVHGEKRIVANLITYVPIVINTLYIAQFAAFGLSVEKLHLTLNNILNRILKDISESQPFLLTNHQQIEQLYNLQSLQNKLYRTCIHLNDLHSFPLLLLSATQFMLLFAASYYCLYGYSYESQTIKPQTTLEYFLPIIIAADALVQLLITTAISERIAKQRNATGKLIYNLPSNSNENLTQWVIFNERKNCNGSYLFCIIDRLQVVDCCFCTRKNILLHLDFLILILR